MTHIIDNVFLGSYWDSMCPQIIDGNNIRYVISVSYECNSMPHYNHYKPDAVLHQRYDILGDQDMKPFIFETIYQTIKQAQQEGKGVLIHCVHGMHRSPTFVLYYLLRRYQATIDESLNYLKQRRPVVDPPINYLNLLLTLPKVKQTLLSIK